MPDSYSYSCQALLVKRLMRNFIFILTLFVGFLGAAQTTISGIVIDGEFNEPLPFASVLVRETGSGTTTDFDGAFSIDVTSGAYTLVFSFVGYQTQEISNVDAATENVELTVTLEPATQGLEEVVVSVSATRNTEQSVLSYQKKAASLLDGISSQSFKKSGAGDIASAIKSVPGVSVQGGKYVYVRGLGDRYTKSILNGVDIPGLDPDRNTIQMDLFPTSILSNVIVIKSSTAELPADFTGATVDIETKDVPNSKQQSISVSAEYNPDMHFNPNYLTYQGSSTDFLGFDDGTRNLPTKASILGSSYDPRFGVTLENATKITDLTKSFDPTLAGTRQSSGMNYSFGYAAANAYDVGTSGNRIGVLGALSYKNSTDYYDDVQNNILNTNQENKSIFALEPNRMQRGSIGSNNVILSGMLGVSFKTALSKYKLNLLHIQNGQSRAGDFRQETRFSDFIDFNKDNLEYTERSITNVLLSGVHSSSDGDWKTTWKISPSISKNHDKDVRVTAFQDEEGVFSFKENTEPKRIWRTLDEVALVGKVDFSKKYSLFDNNASLKFGAYTAYKQRDFSIAQISVSSRFSSPADWLRYNGDPNKIFDPSNIWTFDAQNGTHINAQTTILQEANIYDASQLNAAGYVSNEFRINERLRSIMGLRLEMFHLYYTGSNSQQGVYFNNERIIDKLDLFPSVNLIYELTDNANLRTAYYRTTARPSFKEASIAEIFDPLSNIVFIGNVDIKPTYIDNIDLRYEYFGENAQMIAFSAFYKRFKDPIELGFVAASTSNFRPQNLGNATVYGVEVEFRKNLGFISGLDLFDIKVNASIIEAFQKYSEAERLLRTNGLRTGETLSDGRSLQGQSPYLVNAAIDFNVPETNLQGSLGYNVQGKTLEVVGDGFYPDVFTLPFNSLNLNMIKGIGDKHTLTLKLNNLLNENRESVFESFGTSPVIFSNRNIGRSISVGYSLTLD